MTCAGLAIRRKWEAAPSSVLICYVIAALGLGACSIFSSVFAGSINIGSVMFNLCLGLLVYFPVFIQISHLVGEWFGGVTVDAILWKSTVIAKPKSMYGKAFALSMHNDIPGAVRQFKAYFDVDTKEPSPLFYAAEVLAENRDYHGAAHMYLRIMQLFEPQVEVWAGAAYLLAELYHLHLNRPEDARKTLRLMLDKSRNLHLRKLATGQLEMLSRKFVEPGTVPAE